MNGARWHRANKPRVVAQQPWLGHRMSGVGAAPNTVVCRRGRSVTQIERLSCNLPPTLCRVVDRGGGIPVKAEPPEGSNPSTANQAKVTLRGSPVTAVRERSAGLGLDLRVFFTRRVYEGPSGNVL